MGGTGTKIQQIIYQQSNKNMWNNNDLIPATEITDKVTAVTVDFAIRFGHYLGVNGRTVDPRNNRQINESKLTTSQLRKFFGEVKKQQMQGYDPTAFILLKPKLAYAVGRADRNSKIKDFYTVISDAIDKVSDKKSFDNFILIFEAIVAYHKAAEEQNL